MGAFPGIDIGWKHRRCLDGDGFTHESDGGEFSNARFSILDNSSMNVDLICSVGILIASCASFSFLFPECTSLASLLISRLLSLRFVLLLALHAMFEFCVQIEH